MGTIGYIYTQPYQGKVWALPLRFTNTAHLLQPNADKSELLRFKKAHDEQKLDQYLNGWYSRCLLNWYHMRNS